MDHPPPVPSRDRRRGRAWPAKTAQTLFVMAAALATPYATPALRGLRVAPAPWDRRPLDMGASDEGSASVAAPSATPPPVGEQSLPASENMATINNALPLEDPPERPEDLPGVSAEIRASLRAVPIEDPSGHALEAFFERLARTERKESVTRILHYGDSMIASDYVSGTARRRLQARFGDAGHGFILIANPWEWYFHNDVVHSSDGEWTASRLAGPAAADGMYGLGGVSFVSYGGGSASFGTANRGAFGRSVSRFDLYYLEQPGGGSVELTERGSPAEHLSTRGDAKVARVHSVRVPDGEGRIGVRAIGGGPVRLFGMALERDRPGVVYDALGSHAAMAVYWRRQSREHWRREMELRDPALVIFQYGTNESDLRRLDRTQYEQDLAELVDELHDVAPRASLLVVAPLDRAEFRGGTVATKPVILDLVSIQRRVALTHGAAFWSTFEAMGGEGAMARWVRSRPQLAGPDLTHPTPLGAEIVGNMLSRALVHAYEAHERH